MVIARSGASPTAPTAVRTRCGVEHTGVFTSRVVRENGRDDPLNRPHGVVDELLGAILALRNIIARTAVNRGWELLWSSSVMQEYRRGDVTIKVRYLHTGAIWHAEWSRGGMRRVLDSHHPNKREAIVAWLAEGPAAGQSVRDDGLGRPWAHSLHREP